MYDPIGKVKENNLSDDGISEESLANRFCNLFEDKINNIRNMLKDYSGFILKQ